MPEQTIKKQQQRPNDSVSLVPSSVRTNTELRVCSIYAELQTYCTCLTTENERSRMTGRIRGEGRGVSLNLSSTEGMWERESHLYLKQTWIGKTLQFTNVWLYSYIWSTFNKNCFLNHSSFYLLLIQTLHCHDIYFLSWQMQLINSQVYSVF